MSFENSKVPKEATLFFPRLDYLEEFTVPKHNKEDEIQAFNDFIKLVPTERPPYSPYDHALVIGRFQPLHYGHLYLIKQALNIAESVTIGIGSANVRDTDNPFSPEEREYMLRKALKREKLTGNVLKIVYLDDNPSDDVWLKETLGKVKPQVVVGNNGWVNGIFEGGGIDTWEVPHLNRMSYEGKTIRAHLRSVNKL